MSIDKQATIIIVAGLLIIVFSLCLLLLLGENLDKKNNELNKIKKEHKILLEKCCRIDKECYGIFEEP